MAVCQRKGGNIETGRAGGHVLRADRDGGTIRVCKSGEAARGTINHVEAIDSSIRHDGRDLVAQSNKIVLQRVAAGCLETLVEGRDGLLLHFYQQVRDRLARGQADVNHADGVIQSGLDGFEAGNLAAHVLSNHA